MSIEYKSYHPKNNYTFRIQKLYKYKHLLQEITKELNKMLKKNEIEKLTTTVSFNPKDSNKILESVKQKNAKTKEIYLFNLVAARKILLDRIPILELYIQSIPIPQNFNNEESNNEESNINELLSKSKPKSKPKKMTEKGKLKMQRKEAEKSLSKKSRGKNLKNTYLRKKAETKKFLNKQSKQELDERMWEENLNNENNQNSNSNLSGWNHQNNGHSIMLSEREANTYNKKYAPKGYYYNNSTTNDSTYSPMSPNSINSEIFNNSDITRSLKNRTKFFLNEESNSGNLSNSQFLSSRYKRTGKTKSKRSILNLKHLE